MSEAAASSPSIAALLRNYSVEVSPQSDKAIDSAVVRLEPGTEVYLTWIPGEDFSRAVAPAARLRQAGFFPVPHIGARHLEQDGPFVLEVDAVADEGSEVEGRDRAHHHRRETAHDHPPPRQVRSDQTAPGPPSGRLTHAEQV